MSITRVNHTGMAMHDVESLQLETMKTSSLWQLHRTPNFPQNYGSHMDHTEGRTEACHAMHYYG